MRLRFVLCVLPVLLLLNSMTYADLPNALQQPNLNQTSEGSIDAAVTYYANGDYSKALPIFQALAEQGNSLAEFHLGFMHNFGYGVLKDPKEAAEWFRKAAEKGGEYNLGNMYSMGRGVLKDEEKVVYWYRKAAEKGDVRAQISLGIRYGLGKGVSRDEKKAVYWYRKAADQGDATAQYLLGHSYCNGFGVKKNLKSCALWVKKAHKSGHSRANKTWNKFELWKHQ